MKELIVDLGEPARRVFVEIQQHKAMPLLEISAVTGIRGVELNSAINSLVQEKLVTLSHGGDLAKTIVSISGKYF